MKFLEDTGGGYTDIPGATDSQYILRNTTQRLGSIQVNNYLRTFASGTKIKIQIQDVGIVANSIARMTVKRLK